MSTVIFLSKTRVIKTRTKAPLVIVAIWPSSTEGEGDKAALHGYSYSASGAATRQRRLNARSTRTRYVVLPVRNGQVEVTP